MPFPAELVAHRGREARDRERKAQADAIAGRASKARRFASPSIKKREVARNAPAPFTTSTLQQEASRKLKMRVRRDDAGRAGALRRRRPRRQRGHRRSDHLHAHRLDAHQRPGARRRARVHRRDVRRRRSTAAASTRCARARRTRTKRSGRPRSSRTPEHVAGVLKRDELRLYTLIWERFVASQMAAALLDQTTVDIDAERATTFRATGTVMRFPGFTARLRRGQGRGRAAGAEPTAPKGSARPLPELNEDEALDCRKHRAQAALHRAAAALHRSDAGQGARRERHRPAVDLRDDRRDDSGARLRHASRSGASCRPRSASPSTTCWSSTFPNIVDLRLHRPMEGDLDKVADGQRGLGRRCCARFYGPFASELEEAEKKLPRSRCSDEPTDEICPNCGRPMVIKTGRFGRFISCTGYPECKTTKPIVKDTGAKCPKDGGMIVERRSKKGRTFYGCANYPNCDFVSWDRVVPEPCPVCGSYVVAKTRRGGHARSNAPPTKSTTSSASRERRRASEAEPRARTRRRRAMRLTVIGGGLAGCEAAWQAARCGVDVELYEMRPAAQRTRAQDRRSRRARVQQLAARRGARERGGLAQGGAGAARFARSSTSAREARGARGRRARGRSRAVRAGGRGADRGASAHSRCIAKRLRAIPLDRPVDRRLRTASERGASCATSTRCSPRSRRRTERGGCTTTMPRRRSWRPNRSTNRTMYRKSRYDKGDGDDYLNIPLDREQYLAARRTICARSSAISPKTSKTARAHISRAVCRSRRWPIAAKTCCASGRSSRLACAIRAPARRRMRSCSCAKKTSPERRSIWSDFKRG